MSGMQSTYLIRNGKTLIKVLVVTIVVIITSGCRGQWWLGDGRGDGSYQLSEKYELDKVNTYDVFLVIPYSNSELQGGRIAIEDFSVLEFQNREDCILLKGIQANSLEEYRKRIDNEQFVYYLVITKSDSIWGPFVLYEDLLRKCEDMSVIVKDEWTATRELDWK